MTDKIDDGRAREAKGSVQEAIGKLIGDASVEQRGASESASGALDADAATNIAALKTATPPAKAATKSKSATKSKPAAAKKPALRSKADQDGEG